MFYIYIFFFIFALYMVKFILLDNIYLFIILFDKWIKGVRFKLNIWKNKKEWELKVVFFIIIFIKFVTEYFVL